MFYYSRDRKGEHPQAHLARYAGILKADGRVRPAKRSVVPHVNPAHQHPCDAVNHRSDALGFPKMREVANLFAQPALCGRQVCCGFLQSIPSSI